MADTPPGKPPVNWPHVGTIEHLETRSRGIPFVAEFLANGLIRVKFGTNQRHEKAIPRDVLVTLAATLCGRRVPVFGEGSVHEYLADRAHDSFFSETRLASYVCPLLVYLGLAEYEGTNLRFH
jgi:hypothetical protein